MVLVLTTMVQFIVSNAEHLNIVVTRESMSRRPTVGNRKGSDRRAEARSYPSTGEERGGACGEGT